MNAEVAGTPASATAVVVGVAVSTVTLPVVEPPVGETSVDTVNVSFKGIEGAAVVLTAAREGVCLSAGSQMSENPDGDTLPTTTGSRQRFEQYRQKVKEKRLPYIVLLTDPTTGGVSASFAMQGDVILAEPGAVIGFAGQRVIKQTIGQDLPEGFQTAEFLLDHGMLDAVVHRRVLKQTVGQLLRHMSGRPAATGWA